MSFLWIQKVRHLFWVMMWSCIALGLIACGDSSHEKNQPSARLIIGTSADNPPFEFYETAQGKQQIQGYDIDLGYAIGDILKRQVEFIDMDFNALIPALQSGRLHMIIAGMAPTSERAKNIDFSNIYFKSQVALITRAGVKMTQESQLQGKKVGVQLGSTHELLLRAIAERVKDVSIVSRNRLGELVQELRSHRIDAVLTEDTVARAYVGSNLDIDANILEGHEGEFAIALPKDSPLLPSVNEALQKLQASGKLNQLRNKWFPIQ